MACPARPRTAQRIRPFVMRRRRPRSRPSCPAHRGHSQVVLDERERAVYDAVRAATQADLSRLHERG